VSGLRGRRRLAALVATACALVLTAPSPALAQTSLPDIEDEVMCTICGTLLELSQSPQADREREFIRELIAEGRTKEEIKRALVDQYGQSVLATPDDEGFDLTAWLVPGIGIAVALGAIALALLRRRARGRAADDTGAELDPADLSKLERDMSSYDT
jgi:cytochrome c-type biogenesis protein CcmH